MQTLFKKSTDLLKYPSFLRGVARLFDFQLKLNKYHYSKSGREADVRALKSDWKMIGSDLTHAIKSYESRSTR